MPSSTRWIDLVRAKLDALPVDPVRANEIVEELAHQLEDAYLEATARGLDESEAEREALSQFPDWKELSAGIALAVRTTSSAGRTRWRESMRTGILGDLKWAFRLLVVRPGFSVVAVLALALGIGANTVAFTFVKSMLLGSLPVSEPERLIRIYGRQASGMEYAAISYADLLDLRERAGFLDGILVEKLAPLNLGTERGNERIWGYVVSGDYFDVLGLAPARGQFFHDKEDEPGAHPVAVLSYGFWKRAFGGDDAVVGETIRLNGYPFTIVGVAPESFTGTNVGLAPSLWAPASMTAELIPGYELRSRNYRGFLSLARLPRDMGIEEARKRLDVIAKGLEREFPDTNRGFSFRVLPESEGGIHPLMRGGFVGFAGVLVTVVALVLLLACANVAGLLLSRAFYRRKEVSLRLALGATRVRLVRQLLTESLLLSFVAGAAGIAIAWGALRLVSAWKPPTDIPLYLPLFLDGQVLSVTVAVTLATALLFGLAPALQASRFELVPSLKEGRGGGTPKSFLRNALVVGQIALSTVLLVGTGLFLRSLSNAHSIDLGFDPRGVVMGSIDLGLQGYDEERGRAFFRQLTERLSAIPGVDSVGFVNMVPFDFNINTNEVAPEGYEPPPGGGYPAIDRNVVSAGYFETMRIPILDGRDFSSADTPDSPPVVIINETLAHRFWPGERAVGKRLGRTKMYEVVGVVGDGKYLSLGEEPKPFLFYSHEQRGNPDMSFLVRSEADPATVQDRIRDEIHALDPALPVFNVEPMERHLRIALAPARAGAAVLGSFGILALILASIGLYGVVAFRVAQQTFEIGIRRALGARPGDIARSVLRAGMILVLPGLGLGLLASGLASRFAVSLLYGISALDPVAFLAAPVVLVGMALVACLVPTRRAVRVEPVEALHYE